MHGATVPILSGQEYTHIINTWIQVVPYAAPHTALCRRAKAQLRISKTEVDLQGTLAYQTMGTLWLGLLMLTMLSQVITFPLRSPDVPLWTRAGSSRADLEFAEVFNHECVECDPWSE